MKLIYIQWFDAYYSEERCAKQDIRNESPCILESVGILVDISDQYICFATEVAENGDYKFRHYIPKCNIIQQQIMIPKLLSKEEI